MKLKVASRLTVHAVTVVAVLCPVAAHAIGTPAGTTIQNTAQVSYDLGGTPVNTSSNPTTLTVAEIVNVNVTVQTPTVTVAPGAANRVVVMRVTNTGNGPETFRFVGNSVVAGDDFDPLPAINMLYFDSDASGDLSGPDIVYAPGSNDPLLAADAAVTILIVNNIPSGLPNGQTGITQLTATSLTGSGAPGTVYAGQGAGGVDAMLGASGGVATSSGSYIVASMQLSAVKSQAVSNSFGGATPVPGARIDYQIVMTPTGTGTAANVQFSDGIPANTTYVAGSLRVNTIAQTDAADADAGQYSATPTPMVRASLGDLTQASGAQTIVFSVTIN